MIFLVSCLVLLLFGFVLLFGAPYVPTRQKQVEEALDLLDLKKGQKLLELGCGDGKVLLTAAKRGLNVVGYELNPLLAIVAYLRTWKYRKQVKIIWGNFWTREWPESDGIYVFLIERFMERLGQRLDSCQKPVKVVSYAFRILGKNPNKTKGALFLYKYEGR